MLPRIKRTLALPYVLLLLFVLAVCFCRPASAEACQPLPTDKGTASTTFSVSTAGTYRLWTHVYTPSSGGSAFGLAIDNSCPVGAGEPTSSRDAFSWTNATHGTNAPITVDLATGTHTITIAGQDAAVGVDRILLLSSASCVPAGNGSNCMADPSATDSSGASKPQTGVVTNIRKITTARLTAYVIAAAVGAGLITIGILYYAALPNSLFGRIPLFRREPQLWDQPATVPIPGGYNLKRTLLFALGFAIAGGLVTYVALAASDHNVVVSLSEAQVSGQAKIVARADAIDGHMVQFGDGTPSQPATAPAPHSATPPPNNNPGTSNTSGSSTSGSQTPGNPLALMSGVSCNYQTDTWSGDASGVGYSVAKVSSKDGNPASFSVKINAHQGTTEVVGYPSDQCILYSALPSNLSSSFSVTPPAASSGLDYEYAYDIWLTTAAAAQSYNWNNDLELMIWTYTNGQVPAGSVKATLADGSKVWIDGDNSTGIVSVVLPSNQTTGSVNIASLISQLKAKGYVNNSYNGILDVEYGIEAPYGGGQTFAVNSVSLSN